MEVATIDDLIKISSMFEGNKTLTDTAESLSGLYKEV